MRLHIEFFEPVMDPLIVFAREDGIAFRIVSGPSIEMNRGVERVGRVADVMAQDAGVIDNALFDPFALVRIALGAPQAELDAQALKKFGICSGSFIAAARPDSSWPCAPQPCASNEVPINAAAETSEHSRSLAIRIVLLFFILISR